MSDEQINDEITQTDPISTQEPVEQETTEVESDSEVLAQSDEDESKKDPWYKRRIDELTRDKHEARRHAERLEKLLEQQSQSRQPEPQQTPTIQPPDPNDFAGGQYDPRYIQAQLEYTRVSAIQEAKRAVAEEYEQRIQAQQQAEAQAKLETAEAAARAKFTDYDAVIEGITSDPRLSQSQTIRQAYRDWETTGKQIGRAHV